jgi:phosphonate transport system permease protein
VRAALAVPRAVHEILWGLFFLNIFGLNPMTVILAIGIHFGAATAKVVSEILDETPRDAYHALRNAGAPSLAAFFYALIPQATPNLVAYGFYRFECAIRASAILGVVGAGGLGYQLYLSLDSLAYRQVWTLFYAMVFLSGLTDLWSSLIRGQLNSAARTSLCVDVACGNPNTSKAAPQPISAPTWVSRYSLPIFGVLLVLSLLYVRPDFGIFFAERTQKLWAQIVSDLFPPRLDLAVFLNSAAQTVAMSILALVIASVIGIVMAFPAAQNFALANSSGIRRRSWQQQLRRALGLAMLVTSRTLLLFMRAIPAPVWALILLFVLFPGILPGAVALGIYAGGILGRLMAETAENLDDRPQQALRASGASGLSTFLYAVLPSASPQFLSYILYRWEVCIRETIIVGLVGAGGVGRLLNDQLVAFDYRSIMGTLAGIIVMTFLVDLCSSAIRRQLR